jgi:hypothetical protein
MHYNEAGALDTAIYGPDGKMVPRTGDDPDGIYTEYAQHVKGEMLARYPEMAKQLNWGQDFTTKDGKRDSMHWDTKGRDSPIFKSLKPVEGVQYGVAIPDVAEIKGQAPPGSFTPQTAQLTGVVAQGTGVAGEVARPAAPAAGGQVYQRALSSGDIDTLTRTVLAEARGEVTTACRVSPRWRSTVTNADPSQRWRGKPLNNILTSGESLSQWRAASPRRNTPTPSRR